MKKIKVKIGRKEYDTYIDKNGVQRFIENKVVRYLVDEGIIDLNKLRMDFHDKKFPTIDYLEFYMLMGYSVCGFSELSVCGFSELSPFYGYQIKNPLWEDKKDE